jgi:hypothetical protein
VAEAGLEIPNGTSQRGPLLAMANKRGGRWIEKGERRGGASERGETAKEREMGKLVRIRDLRQGLILKHIKARQYFTGFCLGDRQ